MVNQRSQFNRSAIALGMLALALGSLQQPATAEGKRQLLLAQEIAGQCRAARQNTFIYRERNLDSAMRALYPNERVTLADSGSDGWVAVIEPIAGFVRSTELKSCVNEAPVTTTPPRPSAPAGVCRQVSWEDGLEVQREPNGDRIGGVEYAQRITLTGNERLTVDSERKVNRVWAEISSPLRGWIPSGIQGGGTNLAPCGTVVARPRPAPQPAPAPDLCRQVTWKDGLIVQNAPNGTQIGGLSFEERVRVTGRERVLPDSKGQGSRVWVEVSSPIRGWVTDGLQGAQGRNLGLCR